MNTTKQLMYHDMEVKGFKLSNYSNNGRTALIMYLDICDHDLGCNYVEGEVVTVNIDWFISTPKATFLDTNNHPDILEFLVQNGFATMTGLMGYSGRCEYPEVIINLDELSKYPAPAGYDD